MDAVEPSVRDLLALDTPDQPLLVCVQLHEAAETLVDKELSGRFALRGTAILAGALAQLGEKQLTQRRPVKLGCALKPLEVHQGRQFFLLRETIRNTEVSGVPGETSDRGGTRRRKTQSLPGKDIDIHLLRKACMQIAVTRLKQQEELSYALVLVLKRQQKGLLCLGQDLISRLLAERRNSVP